MLVRVFVLRYRGRRLPWRDVINGHGLQGGLTTCTVTSRDGSYRIATLVEPSSPIRHLLPDLYEPVLTTISVQGFKLRGLEAVGEGEDTYSVVQEWYCEVP